LVPLVLLAGSTVLFWTTDIDMAVERALYDPVDGWARGQEQPWRFLYDWGVVPAWIVALGSLAILITSIFKRNLARYRRVAIYYVLVMAVGPGLIVNSAFKQQWGRPRPKDVYEFGGDRDYVQVWHKRDPGMGNSFASGHAATGFFLFSPFLVLRRKSLGRALAYLALGIVYGSVVGYARMLQGAHFLSDVVWAAGFVYLTALGFYYLLRLDRPSQPST